VPRMMKCGVDAAGRATGNETVLSARQGVVAATKAATNNIMTKILMGYSS